MSRDAAARPRIVVGVDGSDGSKQALRWAHHLATRLGARLDVVAVWEYHTVFNLTALPELEFPSADVERSLAETVDEVLGADRPADLRLKALAGPTVETLATASEGALMLVVGGRGDGGFAGLLLGSVSAKLAEHARCPVLVVQGDTPPPST